MTAPIVVRTGGLGEALTQIGTAIGQLRDPDKERREAFENMLISTPGALARVAQDIRQNPELAQQILDFVPPEVREQIAGAPQTTEQRVDDLTQRGLASLVKQREELATQIAGAAALGKTPEEIALLEEQLRIIDRNVEENQAAEAAGTRGTITTGVERELAGGLTAGQIAQDRISEETANRAFELMQVLPQGDVNQAALRKELEEYFFDQDNRLAHQQRLALAGLTGPGAAEPGAAERARLNSERNESARMVRDTGVGTAVNWQRFLYNRDILSGGLDANGKALALARGELNPVSADDVALMEIGNAFLAIADEERRGNMGSQFIVVRGLTDQIEQRDRDGNRLLRPIREGFVEQLNAALLLLHNMSKTRENPEGTIPLREAFIPGTRNVGVRLRDPVTGNEIPVDEDAGGPGIFNRLFTGFTNLFRSAPSSRGGTQPQSATEITRQQTQIPTPQAPTGIDLQTLQIDTTTVDPSLFSSPEISMSNLLLIQSGEFTFKEIMENAPRSAVDILRALRPEFQDEQTQALSDSLLSSILEKSGREPLKPEPDAQGVRNQ